ncbi:MAG: hypothetical protein WD876_03010, partial [Candidatus Pacearchaeota archaeon]
NINMGNYDFPYLWFDSAAIGAQFGEDNYLQNLVTSSLNLANLGYSNTTDVWLYNATDGVNATDIFGNDTGSNGILTGTGMNLSEKERFIVTAVGTELSDVETLYYEVSDIDIDDADTWTIQLEDLIGTNDLTFTNDKNDTDDQGVVTVNHAGFSADNLSVVLDFSTTTGTLYYNRLVSEKGLVVDLQTTVPSAANGSGVFINFTEANRNDDLDSGMEFRVLVKNTTNDKLHVASHNLTNFDAEESKDHDIAYVPSDLASKVTFDDSADEFDFTIEYFGEEVTADVQVVAGGSVGSGTADLGGVLVTDAEVSSVSSKNLVVVGGSCINTVAANLVGGAYCGAAWTSATGVGTGQYLVQSYASPYSTGKVAVLVAGYEAAETAAGASRLVNQGSTIDTAVGNKYLGVVGSAGTSTVTKVA